MKLTNVAVIAALVAATGVAAEYHMDEKTRSRAMMDSYRYDLRPGLSSASS